MYTIYPDKIVFHDGFNEELSQEILEIIKDFEHVIFPNSFDKSINKICNRIQKKINIGSKYNL